MTDPVVLSLGSLLQLAPDELAVAKVRFNNFNGATDPLEEYVRNPELVNLDWRARRPSISSPI